MEYIGRVDNQVKIRGFRIELGEVEMAVQQTSGVQDAVVLCREDTPGDKRLVAYVVITGSGQDTVTLRQSLKERLPDYMLPSAFVLLDRLPMTTNGKVDRKALPLPNAITSRTVEYAAPRNQREEIITEIFAKVLHLAEIGIHDNFFDLGGHSLAATQLMARMNRELNVALPLRTVFEAPTVEDLAKALEASDVSPAGFSGVVQASIQTVSRTGSLPASSAQTSLWLTEQLDPNNSTYNEPFAWRIVGELDVHALSNAIEVLAQRHETLRTVFEYRNGNLVQVIRGTEPYTLPIVDVTTIPMEGRLQRVQRLIHDEAHRPFDLQSGPLFRALLIREAEIEYRLLLNFHHIIFDGWSLSVLTEELGRLYGEITQGVESTLAPLPIQYADFAQWHNQWMTTTSVCEQLSYWQTQLGGALPLLHLPTDRPRPAKETFRGSSYRFVLPKDLTMQLREMSRKEDTTLYMTLLAAYQALLFRYTGQEDILVGSPVAGRTRAETEGLIGYFVNTLVYRTDFSGNPTVKELLQRVRGVALDAYANQDVPFETLVKELQPNRDASYSPVFQTMFVLQNAPESELALPGLSVAAESVETDIAKFDLVLEMVEEAEALSVRVEYNKDLFDRETIERLAGHLETLLQAAVEAPEMTIEELPLLTAAERQQILVEWNDTAAEYPRDKCIHELFEEQVARAPTAVAVEYEDEQLTYGELNERSNQLAHYLRKLGVEQETLVGTCVERSLEMVVGILGVLKAGGAYVPMDPAYPKDRLAYMLEDSSAPVLLTKERLVGELPSSTAKTIVLDRDWHEIADEQRSNPVAAARPDNLAYVIYTSGSTGRPKGVMLEHHGVVNMALEQIERFGLDSTANVIQLASFSFDASVWELVMALIPGGTICMGKREDLIPGPALNDFIRQHQITIGTFTPPALLVMDSEADGLETLKTIIVAGDACPEELATSWGPNRQFFDAYGPTETTVCATMSLWEGQGIPHIGRPIRNAQAYVLNHHQQLLPIGVPGELYIGGVGVARGYLNHPDLTSERFLPNHLSQEPGTRMYKTGDLVKWRPDGNLEYIGRIDNQVKIRGFRIELGEVESTVQQSSGVNEAVVIVREDEAGDKRLVAYVVSGTDADASSLRQSLKEKLPGYMVPSAFVFMDCLPLTPNGKVDRKALAALPTPDYTGGNEYVAPHNPAEELMAGIWQELLHVSQVSVEENFFELGGHSLLATQLVSRIQQVFETTVPVRAVFESPTVVELTKRVQSTSDGSVTERIPLADRDSELPLSYSQEQLWLIDQMEPGTALYNVPMVWRLRGALNVGALENAIQAMVERHESLRTVFANGADGQPIQVTQPYEPVPLSVDECTDEEHAKGLVTEEIHRPFDLKVGPLWRARLMRLSSDEYFFIVTTHHVVSDGWSMGVLSEELKSLYTAFVQREESPLQPLAIHYADYAVWQREWLGSGVLEQQLTYWREKLGGEFPLLQLPTDRPRPVQQTSRGTGHPFTLSVETLKQLRVLSQREGTTLFMTLLAAYQTLLMRYTGQEDILVGAPSAGRNRPETENLIGYFVNTLVYRTDLSGNPSFRELLRRVREVTLGAYEHQDIPFEVLVEALQPKRDPSYSPIFQTMFVLQNGLGEQLSLPGLEVTEESIELDVAKFDLTLSMVESAEGLEAYLEYNTDLFDKETIQRMAGHLEVLLQAAVQAPEMVIGELPLLTEGERHQILVEWNDTAVEYPRDKCIHELFEEQVTRTPDAVAVEYEEEQLTYWELNERANHLAHYLRGLGVEQETLVGICVERSLEMVVGILGILKAGGAYVPMDPAYPKDRLAYMLEDSGAPVVLTQERLVEALPACDARVVALDSEWDTISVYSARELNVSGEPNNVAYVIYTSGSTGKPKGVQIEHHGVVNLVFSQVHLLSLQSPIRMLQFAAFSFDAFVWEITTTLLSGSTLIMVPREALLDDLSGVIARHNVDTALLPPSLLASLDSEKFPSLRTLLTGGEACTRNLVDKWSTGRLFYNAYGPTEASVIGTMALCTDEGDMPPIGRPIDNAHVYAFNSQMCPVPIGIPGELYIGGEGVARGYLNRPALTKERFLPNPFSQELRARMYRTGDLVKWRPDGNLEYIGRIDNQVKIRGFRIELGEVEAVVQQSPGVHEAVVIVRDDEPGDKRLVAYVVSGIDTDASSLRQSLKEKLPGYMVPSAFVFMDGLPLTPNGKVDRKALAALPTPDYTGGNEYVAPHNPAEELMAGIWQELLHVSQVSVEENFFELGGHSLLATQLVSRIQQVFETTVPVRAVFESPTVVELTKRVQSTTDGGVTDRIPLADRSSELPLSHSQEQLWLIDQMEPGTALYNVPMVWRLRGVLNVGALENAIQAMIQRHESLRTVFVRGANGQPAQVVQPYEPIPLPVTYCADEDETHVLISEETNRPFDLENGPLWRAQMTRLHSDEHIFMFTMHHVVSDGWSMGVLAQELKTLYTAFAAGEGSPLQALPIQYADYAVWQREWLEDGVLEQQLSYWREKLAGELPMLQLPTDRPRPTQQTYHGAGYQFTLSVEILERLQVLSQREGTTLFMTLLAAYQTLLMRYTGQEDILVGAPSAGRSRPETENLIGYFVNTLTYRTDLSGNPSFRELLHRVREVTLGAYEHQDVPFETLVETLQPKRDPSYSPIFQTMFVLQNGLGEQLSLSGLEVTEESVELDVAKFDLILSMVEKAEGLEAYLEYNTDLFDKETIQRMAGHLEVLLQGAVRAPEMAIGELPILTETEQQQILVEWNDTAAEYPRDRCMHELFEEQVARTPDAVAVEYEEEQLTYRELNERANQLAHYLRKLGVEQETLIGICVERSLEMVVGILGILKAGGAYVPMDPAYPKDRLAYMLEDSGAPVILTQARLIEELPPSSAKMIALDRDWHEVTDEQKSNPVVEARPDNLAYVIYTSGSTGKPKGVQVEHRGVGNLAWEQQKLCNINASSRVIQLASFSFDAAVSEMVMALFCGATLCLGNRDSLLPGAALTSFIHRHRVTVATFTPSSLTLMDEHATELSSLSTLIVAGESCPPELAIRWAVTGRSVLNGYGPTEATVCATMGEMQNNGELPIGKPLNQVCVYVVSQSLQPVPIGVPGELYIGGVGVARGYLNRPDLTSERFLQDPFSQEQGARMYRTGDLVKWRPDGNLEYIGRIDDQVKIRGFRIELGEVESAVQQLPGVRDAAIIVQEDESGDKRLTAYVVVADGGNLNVGAIRKAIKERLPGYMVPSTFQTMEKLLLTPNGKVDRKGLAALKAAESDSGSSVSTGPRDTLELVMLQIWKQVLGTQDIGIYDDFFELGGHSLKVVALRQAIREQLQIDIPISAFFSDATPVSLCEWVRSTEGMPQQSLVTLQSGDASRPPIFLIHEVSGGVLEYLDLCREIGLDQTVYGLIAPGYDSDVEPLCSVHDMASRYVEEIRQVAFHGPYNLIGWSFGALVAFEMARLLETEGEQVAFLGLLDAHPFGDGLPSEMKTPHVNIAQVAERLDINPVSFTDCTQEEAVSRLAKDVVARGLVPEKVSYTVIRRQIRVMEAHTEAIETYHPSGRVQTDITLFEAEETGERIDHEIWAHRTMGEFRVRKVSGTHLTMVRSPHVTALASDILEVIGTSDVVPPHVE